MVLERRELSASAAIPSYQVSLQIHCGDVSMVWRMREPRQSKPVKEICFGTLSHGLQRLVVPMAVKS